MPLPYDGRSLSQLDEVQLSASRLQLPPRLTRCDPEEEPLGSVPYAKVPYQSRHHSHTLPCMSYNPHGFALFDPTGWVVELGVLVYQM